jgi:dolichyl-diphosphooligosaccharide--protein glycosyltransferase
MKTIDKIRGAATPTRFIKKNIVFIALVAIFIFALAIRILPSFDIVFSDPVKYSYDDGIYHMRLVENMLLGNHSRIYFDPFTNFPHGSYIHFTPLFDWIFAAVIWLISLGKPTLESINKIAPFIPAVMGAGIVLPVYFLCKAIFKNRATAVLAAFFAVISPVSLFRSVLGYSDHHVSEVLLSTLAILFLVLALQHGRKKQDKKFWILAVLCGFSLGLYFLAWTGATMFLFLFFCFLVFYYLLRYFFGDRQNWILWLGITIFFISFLMILPFFGHPDLFNTYMYNIVHILAFSLGTGTFFMLLIIDRLFFKKGINPKLMPLYFTLALGLFFVLLRIFSPSIFGYLVSAVKEVNTGMVEYIMARELVSEMQPASFGGLVQLFQMVLVGSLVAIAFAIYEFFKTRKPETLFLPLWLVFILLMTGVIPFWGQARFAYYLAPIFSILLAYLLSELISFGWESLQKAKELANDSPYKKYVNYGGLSIIFIAFFVLLYPFPFNLDSSFPKSLPYILQPIAYNSKLMSASKDRYDLLSWLKTNTPDPGVDYYGLYQEPGVNKETGQVNDYEYPDSSYGVLAVWDLGHMITYYSHRMAIANPFQEGIGRKNSDGSVIPGWSTFFLEKNEQTATQYLDSLKAKYVIADSASANTDGVYQHMIKWQQDNLDGFLAQDGKSIDMERYYNSMIAKLALFDGKKTNINRLDVPALSHFRLVYESATTDFSLKIDDNQDIKKYKIFEYVKGAVISGSTIPGSEVEIYINIKTNQDRDFTYKNSEIFQNERFEFTVPYAGRYTIKIGQQTKEIEVSENNILNGDIIKL